MPVKIRKTKEGYTTSTPRGVKGRGMSLRDAKRQKRLLNAIEHDPTFKPDKKKKTPKRKYYRAPTYIVGSRG